MFKFFHKGRQFFFFTFCIAGRRPLFGALAGKGTWEEPARVDLTALGKRLIEIWCATHAAHPGATASNFVVMPDHFHCLLIVDYDKEPFFGLGDFIDAFRAQVEAAAKVTPLWERGDYL